MTAIYAKLALFLYTEGKHGFTVYDIFHETSPLHCPVEREIAFFLYDAIEETRTSWSSTGDNTNGEECFSAIMCDVVNCELYRAKKIGSVIRNGGL